MPTPADCVTLSKWLPVWLPDRIDGVAMAMKAERSPAVHITKRTVDALRAGEIVWDDELKGFGVRCRASGAKYYVVKYRADGRQRWYTIGQHGSPWTIKKARDRAKVIRGKVADGTDPAVVRDEDRDDLTVSELCDLYLVEGCVAKKPSTLATDKGRIKRHIKPLLGRKRVRELTRADVQRFARTRALFVHSPYIAGYSTRGPGSHFH